MKIVHPVHWRLVRREADSWYFSQGRTFYNPLNLPVCLEDADVESWYGTSKARVAIELFRINGGRAGYYLANLRDREYHYCGLELADVQAKLWDLGIGMPEPERSG